MGKKHGKVRDGDMIHHNHVVFGNGKNVDEKLSLLVEVVPEAKLNLTISYLNQDKFDHAYELIEAYEPTSSQGLLVKGTALAMVGQQKKDIKLIKSAVNYLQTFGKSPSDCDTIPGRKCMASCLFLMENFEEANIYFSSINDYLGKFFL